MATCTCVWGMAIREVAYGKEGTWTTNGKVEENGVMTKGTEALELTNFSRCDFYIGNDY